MRTALAFAVVAACLFTTTAADAKSSHSSGSRHRSAAVHSGSHHSSASSYGLGSHHNSAPHSGKASGHGHAKADPGLKRDAHGKIVRSEKAKQAFRKSHPCPSTGKTRGACPGYVIDHKQALKHGGADEPSNMQWQTSTEAKAKDKWE